VLSVTIRKLMVSQHAPHTARVQEMYALYQDGATLNKVGERYGVTRERVRQLFNKAGLATRSRREASERNRTPGPQSWRCTRCMSKERRSKKSVSSSGSPGATSATCSKRPTCRDNLAVGDQCRRCTRCISKEPRSKKSASNSGFPRAR
jgi:hypothetical protein